MAQSEKTELDSSMSTTTEGWSGYTQKQRELCMEIACNDAQMGVLMGHGLPFGAMVCRDGITISVQHNTSLKDQDPTCHAEMNAIRYACQQLGKTDLSSCDLFTTCEPCPMCLGGIMRSGIKTLYMGVNRYTAEMYEFEDKVYYDEVEAYIRQPSKLKMIRVVGGILAAEVEDQLFRKEEINTDTFTSVKRDPMKNLSSSLLRSEDKKNMQLAIDAAKRGFSTSKPVAPQNASNIKEEVYDEYWEPFGACIVDTHSGEAIATSGSSQSTSRDSTATAVINTIRKATTLLQSNNLEGCVLYSTSQPDLMSFAACLWAKVKEIRYGVPLEAIALYGYEAEISHINQACEFSGRNGIVSVDTNSTLKMSSAAQRKHKMAVVSNFLPVKCEELFKMWKSLNGTLN